MTREYYECPRVDLVTPGKAVANYGTYEPFIERALEFSILQDENASDVLASLADGRRLLVEIHNDCGIMGVAVIEEIATKEGSGLHVFALAGDAMHLWLDDLVDWLKDTAEGLHCSGVTLTGRKGWIKELQKYGFEYLYCNMRLKI